MKKLRVAWLAPYPVQTLQPHIRLARQPRRFHPCSWIVNLSNALARRPEVELHLVTLSALVPQRQETTVNNIHFHVLRDAIPFTNRGFPPWLPVPLWTGFRGSVAQLGRALERIAPDLVHAHGTESAFAPAAVAAQRPCLISIQGVIAEYCKTEPSVRMRLLRRLERRATRRVHFFTCRTGFDSGFVRSENPTARIFMIPEAMDPVFFANEWTPRDDDALLFVGTIEPRKGLQRLLTALPAIAQARPRLKVRVIGVSAEQAAPLRPPGCVEFLGFQPAATIAREHLAAQAFVLPSENENSPNALAEAMISGLPIVASNIGGIPSMIENGQSGLLVNSHDPQQLAAAIIRLLADAAERQRLGANARRIARERHHPDAVAAQTVAAYREILNWETSL